MKVKWRSDGGQTGLEGQGRLIWEVMRHEIGKFRLQIQFIGLM